MPKRRRVVKIDSDGNDVQVYDTISQAAECERTTLKAIYMRIQRKSVVDGYSFQYAAEQEPEKPRAPKQVVISKSITEYIRNGTTTREAVERFRRKPYGR